MPVISSQTLSLIASTDWLFGQFSADATIREELHNGTQELRDLEVDQIRQRTPQDTLALYDSITGTPYADPKAKTLLWVRAQNKEQVDEWGRVYAPYQEGGPLGLPTFTNPPHEMFQEAMSTDIPLIEAWASKYGNIALKRIASGQGVIL